jgi:flagellar protein FlaC
LGKNEITPSKDDSPSTPEKIPDLKEQPKFEDQPGKKPEPERKIIKFDTPDKPGEKKKEEAIPREPQKKNTPDVTKVIDNKNPGVSADAARDDLEQRRTMLQNMKDLDFQIKKNQEEITTLLEKVENLSKDLDDLVSLYEIVSEQMNPFVGLSKVTKKRLDALENFTKEVEGVKTRIGDLESVLEKNGVYLGRIKEGITLQTSVKAMNDGKTSPETTNVRPTIATLTPLPSSITQNLSEQEVNEILSKSLEALLVEQNIDMMINEFFLSLK